MQVIYNYIFHDLYSPYLFSVKIPVNSMGKKPNSDEIFSIGVDFCASNNIEAGVVSALSKAGDFQFSAVNASQNKILDELYEFTYEAFFENKKENVKVKFNIIQASTPVIDSSFIRFAKKFFGSSTCEDTNCTGIVLVDKKPYQIKLHSKRIWALCSLDDPKHAEWLPGILHSDGRITTILGEMVDPDSPDDIRDFDNCPFEGYKIEKVE